MVRGDDGLVRQLRPAGPGTALESFVLGLALVLIPGWSWISMLVHAVMGRYPADVAAALGVVQIG